MEAAHSVQSILPLLCIYGNELGHATTQLLQWQALGLPSLREPFSVDGQSATNLLALAR